MVITKMVILKYITTNLGTCDNKSQVWGLIITFSQFYLKLNNLFILYDDIFIDR